jgi:hypothetical protein
MDDDTEEKEAKAETIMFIHTVVRYMRDGQCGVSVAHRAYYSILNCLFDLYIQSNAIIM